MKLTGLYGITDTKFLAEGRLLPYVEAALKGGMKVLQYRDKSADTAERFITARALKHLCEDYSATFIINDDILLAHDLSVGLHLGQEDGSIKQARQILGKDAIIGATCHGSMELAKQAKEEGASYLAFGRFFSSKTKPSAEPADINVLQQAKSLGLPICAIGGITLDNVQVLIEQGADLIAVINGLFDTNTISGVEQLAVQFTHLIN